MLKVIYNKKCTHLSTISVAYLRQHVYDENQEPDLSRQTGKTEQDHTFEWQR